MTAENRTLRAVVCGIAATIITVSMSWSMAQYVVTNSWTPAAYGTRPAVAKLSRQHGWFGQPSPAVLVD